MKAIISSSVRRYSIANPQKEAFKGFLERNGFVLSDKTRGTVATMFDRTLDIQHAGQQLIARNVVAVKSEGELAGHPTKGWVMVDREETPLDKKGIIQGISESVAPQHHDLTTDLMAFILNSPSTKNTKSIDDDRPLHLQPYAPSPESLRDSVYENMLTILELVKELPRKEINEHKDVEEFSPPQEDIKQAVKCTGENLYQKAKEQLPSQSLSTTTPAISLILSQQGRQIKF